MPQVLHTHTHLCFFQCLNLEGGSIEKNEVLFTCQHVDYGLLQDVKNPLEENIQEANERKGTVCYEDKDAGGFWGIKHNKTNSVFQ